MGSDFYAAQGQVSSWSPFVLGVYFSFIEGGAFWSPNFLKELSFFSCFLNAMQLSWET